MSGLVDIGSVFPLFRSNAEPSADKLRDAQIYHIIDAAKFHAALSSPSDRDVLLHIDQWKKEGSDRQPSALHRPKMKPSFDHPEHLIAETRQRFQRIVDDIDAKKKDFDLAVTCKKDIWGNINFELSVWEFDLNVDGRGAKQCNKTFRLNSEKKNTSPADIGLSAWTGPHQIVRVVPGVTPLLST